jgi:hypothetical protein
MKIMFPKKQLGQASFSWEGKQGSGDIVTVMPKKMIVFLKK